MNLEEVIREEGLLEQLACTSTSRMQPQFF